MNDGPVVDRPRRRWLALPTVLGLVIGAVCVAFVLVTMASHWSEVRDDLAAGQLPWLALAVVVGGAAMAWVAWCWRDALGALGHHVGGRTIVAWYFAGEIGKYLPGGVWTVVGRGELARRGGIPVGRAYPSVGLSLAALYLSGLAVAAVLVPLDLAGQSESPASLALLLLLPLGLAVLHPRVLGRLRTVISRLTGRGADVPLPAWRTIVGLVLRYVPAWLGIWAATWCVARALSPDPPILRLGVATMLSWTAGVAAVPVPAGAGVREAVFLAASGMPAGLAATVAVASRLVFLLVDVGGAVLTAPWHHRRDGGDDRRATVGGRPGRAAE